MEFARPVQDMLVTSLKGSGELASQDVLSRKRMGRHTITVLGNGKIGSKADIEESRGMSLQTSVPFTFPVADMQVDRLWYSGTVTLVEWF